jgi:cytochrome c oxidase subunit 2
MILGKSTTRILAPLWAALLLALAPQAALAQAAQPAAQSTAAPPSDRVAATQAAPAAEATGAPAAGETDDKADASSDKVAAGASAYKPLGPEWIKGQPTPGGLDVQTQYSPIGQQAFAFHTALLWIMGVISLFVLLLMLYVMIKFRRSAHPVPTRTTHNTTIEVLWTLLPVLILVAIAIPSISLLSAQYKEPPKDAVTVKATGYQWYWGYTYPDNGGFEVISNMVPEDEAKRRGEPGQLAVDNRMVIPAGEWIRLQTTGADVIHSFGVPSLWLKLDAVPGRLNERRFMVKEPGIYYGQCFELCGAKHAYMPIAIEALPRPQFEAWVLAQGGTIGKPQAPAAPSVAPLQQPESGAQQPAGANPDRGQQPVAGASPAPAGSAAPPAAADVN